MIRKLLARGVVSLLVLLFVLLVTGCVLGAFLLHTERGTRWLLTRVDAVVPGEFSIESVDGRLTGPFELTGLIYRDGELNLEIARLEMDWEPKALLRRRLHLLSLAVRQTRLHLPAAEEQTEQAPAEPFQGLSLPVTAAIDELEVEDFRVTPHGAEDAVVVERLALRLETAADSVSIAGLDVTAFDTDAAVKGDLRLTPGLPLNLVIDWKHRLPEGPQLEGSGVLSGDLSELLVNHRFAAPISGELQARLFELESDPRWEATLVLDGTDVGAFSDAFPALVSGRLRSSGSPEAISAQGDLKVMEDSLGTLEAEFDAAFVEGVASLERLLITTPEGARLEGTAHYTPNDLQGQLQADLEWTGLRWPLAGDPVQFTSETGRLKLAGRPSEYSYGITLNAILPEMPAARLDAEGSGDLERLALDALEVVFDEGRLGGDGWVSWQPEPSWQLRLTGTGLNPALFRPELSGLLNLELATKGHMESAIPKARVELARLDGELLDYPVQGSGVLNLDGENLEIDTLELVSGNNRARVNGTAGEVFSLEWSLDATQLETLWPGLSGALDASGRVTGTADAPRLEATLAGSELAFERHRVGSLEATADLGLAEGQPLELDLNARALLSDGMSWEALSLKVNGLRQRHTVEFALNGDDDRRGALSLEAGLDLENRWQGDLQQVRFQLEGLGLWQLDAPAPFALGPARSHLTDLCLVSNDARLCGGFEQEGDRKWLGSVDASRIPLKLIQRWLPPEVAIEGTVGIDAAFTGNERDGIRGRVDLEIPAGSLGFPLEETQQNVDFSGGLVHATIDDGGLVADLRFPLADLGGIEGRAKLPGFRPGETELAGQAVEGRLDARIGDLSLVSLLAPDLENVRGRIEAAFTLAGRVLEPQLRGSAQLEEAAVDIPGLGLELRDIELSVTAPDLEHIALKGGVGSGKGRLSFDGETLLRAEQGFPSRLHIQGKDWMAINTAEAEVHISPDLTIKSGRERTDLEGEILVPFARVRPRRIPESSVSPSPDLVVIGGDKPTEEKQDPRVHSKIRIVLGDRVNFEGFGLRADLTGNLLVIDEPDRPVIGRGRIGVVEGTYRGYGQDLKIERGFALFADSPVDNPGLDVRATREAGEVIAGLQVTGTLKKPTLEVFSTPAMPEGDALSYLLTGRGPGESGGGNAGVSTALQAAGIGSVTSEVGRQLGLDELRVDTGSGLADASVVAGTYLSPRLYVQYVNELATGETVLRLRHDLTDRLQIQTETGRSQGVDLFYTFER